MKASLVICFLCMVTFGCHANQCDLTVVAPYFKVPVDVVGPLSVEEVEQREMTQVDLNGTKVTRPFGYIHADWMEFKSKMRPGDCLFFYKTGDSTWKALHGRQGYILFRDGKPVDAILTGVS